MLHSFCTKRNVCFNSILNVFFLSLSTMDMSVPMRLFFIYCFLYYYWCLILECLIKLAKCSCSSFFLDGIKLNYLSGRIILSMPVNIFNIYLLPRHRFITIGSLKTICIDNIVLIIKIVTLPR